jgi:hypothetical protein
MVSNTLRMDLGELVATLERVAQTCADDPDYVAMRGKLPADWPI